MNEFTRKAMSLADEMVFSGSEDALKFAAARSDLLAHLEGGEQKLQLIRSLIADDAYAMTFQSFGQYRTALLKEIPATATEEASK